MLDAALGIHHALWEGDTRAVHGRDRLARLLGLEPTRRVHEPRAHGPSVDAQLRQRVDRVPDSLAQVRAVGQLPSVRLGLGLGVGARRARLDLVQVRGDGGRREHGGLEVLTGPGGDLALETSVVTLDPAVALLGIPQWVAGEPPDAQLGVGGARKIAEITEDEDGGV